MNKFDAALNSPSDSAQTQAPAKPELKAVQYIVTRVAGTEETGVTIVAESGQGTFHPDVTRDIATLANSKSPDAAQSFPVEGGFQLSALYPHWADSNEGVGIAINMVSKALKDLESAAAIPCNSGAEILNYLVLAETQLFQALPKCRFNKPYEIVVSFCAWAIRNAETSSGECPSLPGMCAALREVNENPFLKSNRSTNILIDLEKQGWSDASTISKSFESAFASRFDQSTEASLF